MTFEEVFKSYMTVSGTERSAAYQDRLMFRFFVSQFGCNFPVEDITPRLVSRALATLRGKLITRKGVRVPLSPSTINRHTQFLQRVMNHATDLNLRLTPIRWKAFIMVEAEKNIQPLSKKEEQYVIDTIDPSVSPLFRFSLMTGVRLTNAMQLRWSMIDWDKKTITFRGKSRRPGGKTYRIPLINAAVKLLRSLRGHHPEYCFTFTAKRNDRHGHKAGKRYPITEHVVRYYWEALDLGKRWHDVRHTFGTRLYEISKDIRLVQTAMNHANIETTMQYVHVDLSDVQEAMERLSFTLVNEGTANGPTPAIKEQEGNVINLQRYQSGAATETRTRTPCSASTSRQRDEDPPEDV